MPNVLKEITSRTKVPFTSRFSHVKKRDGSLVLFDQKKITSAIYRAMHANGEGDHDPMRNAQRVSDYVVRELSKRFPTRHTPHIEEIQDIVEEALIVNDFPKTAKGYILYRNKRAEIRERRKTVPQYVQDVAAQSKKYFRNSLAEFIYYRSYSRWIEEGGRRETWIETVERFMDFMRTMLKKRLLEREYKEIHEAIISQEVMPSMRLMWSAGKAVKTTNVSAYNCSFIAPSRIKDFSEIMYLLMCGTGVGFSVESQTAQRLPIIKRQRGVMLRQHTIGDSKEGWGEALTLGLKTWYAGKDITFNYRELRPAGARLNTMGGRSSGPEPLRALLDFAREKIFARQGKRLRNIDVHDIICKIGEVVVMGGVRRSALISLSDLDDEEMRTAKVGQFYLMEPQRSLANNSAVYNEKPSAQEFLEEWLALARSGSGERGIFNRGGLRSQLPERRWKVFEKHAETAGTNPCGEIVLRSKQFCVGGDTHLITRDGIETIQDVVGKEIEVWNGKRWSRVVPVRTGRSQKLVRVTFGDGSYLDCTLDHKFSVRNRFQNKWYEVQAKDLTSFNRYTLQVEPTKIIYNDGQDYPDAYDLGVVVGDGHVYDDHVFVDLYGEKDFILPIKGIRHKEYLPSGYNLSKVRVRTELDAVLAKSLKTSANSLQLLFCWDRSSILNFVAGLIDADGSETKTGGARLYISDFGRARMVQLLLTKCGIRSSVNLMQKSGATTNLGIRKRDMYYIQITDCKEIPCKRVDISNGHPARFKGKYQTIKSVVELEGLHDSFCFEESEEHKAVFNNVLTYQCNLTEIVARPEDTEESLLRKTRLATILGTYQATLTDFPYISKEWKKNCEEERLLGVSITGQWDSPETRNAKTLRKMRDLAIDVNREYAKRFGINPSTCITCVKPSGTVSQLVDASSGMHARHAKYYIRRVRISATDPLFQMLKEQKFPYYPEVGQTEDSASTFVLEFPVKAPEGSVMRNDLSAIDQLNHWKLVKENYTEHNPSVTVSVGEDEWVATADWLYENWNILGGLSFLPRTEHVYRLAPYEEITQEQYEEFISKVPEIDFSQILIYEKEDHTQGAKELACVGGVCEIDLSETMTAGARMTAKK